jgi:hypothetical protein
MLKIVAEFSLQKDDEIRGIYLSVEKNTEKGFNDIWIPYPLKIETDSTLKVTLSKTRKPKS